MLFRSIASTRSSIARATLPTQQYCRRSISVSAAANAKKQFVVIARDYQDEEAHNRRMEVRPKHMVDARALKKSGTLQLGGALLSDHSESGKMIGSIMIFSAESEAEVAEIIEKDQYVTGKVWEHFQILPFRQAAIDP
ncbi:hypothetical protein BG011_004676 [Mortierella polycephala]|uniref:YCII-related domain-containing protein n=1 Tax=Mortierella polycephala TaxID=41804 RepID=A0A9P6QG09_9FUNG|nr:hypothetical protein BG011_004676 [Mortierella polycephala]